MKNIPITLATLFAFWTIYDVANALECPDGRQVKCDRACPYIYRPVCGSDLQTYPNSCVLYTVRDCCRMYIFILYEGRCKPFGIPPVLVPFPQTLLIVSSVEANPNADKLVQQIPMPILGTGGTVSHGGAAAVSGANATGGNDPVSQHSGTSTSANAGVSTQVGQ